MEAILGAPPNICLVTIPRGLDPRWIRDGDEHLGQCKAEKTAFEEYANLPAHIRVWTFHGVQSNARPKVSNHSYTLREFCIPSLIQRASVVPPTEGATNDSSLRASAMSNRKEYIQHLELALPPQIVYAPRTFNAHRGARTAVRVGTIDWHGLGICMVLIQRVTLLVRGSRLLYRLVHAPVMRHYREYFARKRGSTPRQGGRSPD
ncbi:hypothetical protein BC629DRAFT_1632114 [Irpex lacteus]|nr:hypothetical protein BC629DRAFT_1632114 [Irpex lacteus]